MKKNPSREKEPPKEQTKLIECFTKEEKQAIAAQIKPISLDSLHLEMNALREIGANAVLESPRARTGNNIVDAFTFVQRLETRGKYNVNYFEFIHNLDTFSQKKFIQNMILYYETVKNKHKQKNQYIVWKEIYNICISAINIIRPLVYMEIYTRFGARRVLDFCAGWGGAAVAAAALRLDAYIGVEINHDLKEPYQRLIAFLQASATDKASATAADNTIKKDLKSPAAADNTIKKDLKSPRPAIEMFFKDALTVDYSQLVYDTVFTSPPYYFIQKYANNVGYQSKDEMDELFYKPLFDMTRRHIQPGGHYILNVNAEVYNRVCVPMWGQADETFPYKKSKRQNAYQELVYVYKNNKKDA